MPGLNFRDKIIQSLFRHYRNQEIKLHELNYLFWECTLRCTLSCLHCGSDCKSEANVPDMPAEDFLSVLRKIKDSIDYKKTNIVLTGGEPTLRKDLPDIGLEIRKLGYKWGIVTNGMLYTPELHNKLMMSGMRSLTLSLDGLEESHNWLRNSKHSYDRAIKALKLIRDEKHLNYDVVCCVNKRNLGELPALLKFLEKEKIKAWRLFTIAPIGRARYNDDMLLDPNEFKQLLDFIEEKRKKSSTDIKFSCEAYTGPYENKVRDGFFFCRAGVNIASILADGSISACPNIDRKYSQGNIYTDPFMEVWEKQFYVMRDRSWARSSSCKNCKAFKECRGGAMHLWDAKSLELQQCHYKDLKKATSGELH